MEKLKMPSDAQLMQIAIADLNNSSLSLEDRQRALRELLVLVEPIDNANGRCKYFTFHRCTTTFLGADVVNSGDSVYFFHLNVKRI